MGGPHAQHCTNARCCTWACSRRCACACCMNCKRIAGFEGRDMRRLLKEVAAAPAAASTSPTPPWGCRREWRSECVFALRGHKPVPVADDAGAAVAEGSGSKEMGDGPATSVCHSANALLASPPLLLVFIVASKPCGGCCCCCCGGALEDADCDPLWPSPPPPPPHTGHPTKGVLLVAPPLRAAVGTPEEVTPHPPFAGGCCCCKGCCGGGC